MEPSHPEPIVDEPAASPSLAEPSRPEPALDERAVSPSSEPLGSRSPLRRALLLFSLFFMPCAVIALSLFFIVKGGEERQLASAIASSAPSVTAPPPAEPAIAAPSDAASLETPNDAEVAVAVPGFEDEGSDEEPGPAKPAAPKHFATVQEAAAGSCSTESVAGLSRQIIDQARCIKPNDVAPLPKRRNLLMAAHVYPYLEVAARDHLLRALDAHTGLTMTINSCLRTVAQQYLVSRWAVSKTCGVQLATQPGESNHEIGTALDIAEAAKWRPALEAQEFRWLGSSDRVHFDYKGGSAAPHTATDVLAFQKLWNKNHKDDAIAESGHYDSATEQRLKKAPPSGFAIGASCGKAAAR